MVWLVILLLALLLLLWLLRGFGGGGGGGGGGWDPEPGPDDPGGRAATPEVPSEPVSRPREPSLHGR